MSADWLPLWLSLQVAAAATLLSLPAGWWLAFRLGRGGSARAVAMAPPTVLMGWAGLALAGEGWLVADWKAAVVAALCEAVPLTVLLSRAALACVDLSYERVARTLGASEGRVFWRVSLPLARGPLVAAALAVFARVLGDFGLTLIVAGLAAGRGGVLDASLRRAVESADGGAARLTVVALSGVLMAALGARTLPKRAAV